MDSPSIIIDHGSSDNYNEYFKSEGKNMRLQNRF